MHIPKVSLIQSFHSIEQQTPDLVGKSSLIILNGSAQYADWCKTKCPFCASPVAYCWHQHPL